MSILVRKDREPVLTKMTAEFSGAPQRSQSVEKTLYFLRINISEHMYSFLVITHANSVSFMYHIIRQSGNPSSFPLTPNISNSPNERHVQGE